MRCMVNTVAAVYSQITSGTISMSPRPDSGPKLRRSWLQLEASRTRSSSSCRYLSNSATTSRGFRRRPSGPSRSMMRATIFSRDRSFSMMLSMPGRSTLTATSRPSCSTAKCTWAIEAEATGSTSNCANNLSGGAPSAASTQAAAWADGNGGTRSCSSASSLAISAGIRSRRVDSTWPNLTKMGPSDSSARRSRSPRGWRGRVPSRMTRSRQVASGWFRLESTSSSRP